MLSDQSAYFNILKRFHVQRCFGSRCVLQAAEMPKTTPLNPEPTRYVSPRINSNYQLEAIDIKRTVKMMKKSGGAVAQSQSMYTPIKPSKISDIFQCVEQHNIEALGNHLKAQKVKVVFCPPEEITDIYNLFTNTSSCMRGKGDYVEIVVDNAFGILKATRNGEIVGRAIVWKTRKDTLLLDRCYGGDEVIAALKNHGKKEGYLIRSGNSHNYSGFDDHKGKTFKVKMAYSLDNYDHFPYMDTFKAVDGDYLVAGSGEHIFVNTDGTAEGHGGTVCEAPSCDETFDPENEGAYVENVGYCCSDCVCYDHISDDYIIESDSIEFQWYNNGHRGSYRTHTDEIGCSVLETEAGEYHHQENVTTTENGRHYHEDDENLVFLEDHGTYHIDDDDDELFQDHETDEWHHIDDIETTKTGFSYHKDNNNLLQINGDFYHEIDDYEIVANFEEKRDNLLENLEKMSIV